jgi:hypothetical protein
MNILKRKHFKKDENHFLKRDGRFKKRERRINLRPCLFVTPMIAKSKSVFCSHSHSPMHKKWNNENLFIIFSATEIELQCRIKTPFVSLH